MTKLGIFGGTFNPPHIGHLITVEVVREQLQLDKVMFIPSHIPPHKSTGQIISPELRLEMVNIAIKSNPSFISSDIEIKRKGKSYTVDTIGTILQMYNPSELFLIIGLDNLMEFSQWKSPHEIVSRAELIVMNRPGYDLNIKNEFLRYSRMVRVPNIDISSSEIRKRIKMGKTIKYLVPADIEKFINKNGLYKN